MGTRNRSRAKPAAATKQKVASRRLAKAAIQEAAKRRQEEERIRLLKTGPRRDPGSMVGEGTRRPFRVGEKDYDERPPTPRRFQP